MRGSFNSLEGIIILLQTLLGLSELITILTNLPFHPMAIKAEPSNLVKCKKEASTCLSPSFLFGFQ